MAKVKVSAADGLRGACASALSWLRGFAFPEDIAARAATIDGIKVTDAATYESAGVEILYVKKLLKEIAGHHDAQKTSVNGVRTEMLRIEKIDTIPWTNREARLAEEMSEWKAEQDRIDRERQRREQEEADRKAREEQQARADALKRVAKAEKDPELKTALKDEAKTIEKAPIMAASVPVRSSVPHVPGVSHSKTYEAEVFDLSALVKAVAAGKVPLNAIQADQSFLNKQAKALGETLTSLYPGVKAV